MACPILFMTIRCGQFTTLTDDRGRQHWNFTAMGPIMCQCDPHWLIPFPGKGDAASTTWHEQRVTH